MLEKDEVLDDFEEVNQKPNEILGTWKDWFVGLTIGAVFNITTSFLYLIFETIHF